MKCELNKPSACFNCPYPDCQDTSKSTSFGEVDFLKNSGISISKYHTRNGQRKSNSEMCKRYYKNHTEAAKQRVKRNRFRKRVEQYGYEMALYI